MTGVDFAEWAEPALVLTLGGRDFSVRPPSVSEVAPILAITARSEIRLGLHAGPMPDAVEQLLTALHTDGVSMGRAVLREAYDELVEAGASAQTIDRMAYYAAHYFSRGKARADAVAAALWSTAQPPEDQSPGEAGGAR